ncbi:MAG: alpha-hydroxy-acid oxidizing protein [Gammaproteobacteria bacterium]|nr:alpha-hydroxy-acid oxidizing protein [Gammaproteobacteria bacterium]
MHDTQRPPLAGIPAEVIAAADYEVLAPHFIAPATFAYLAGGSGADRTLAWNRAAFARVRLRQRVFGELTGASTATTLLGRPLPQPVLLAPVAYQGLVHAGAEVDTARGAAAADTPLILSSLATRAVEEVAAAATAGWWYQLRLSEDREADLARLRRAERAGCAAVVVTVDAAAQLPSRGALAAGFTLPSGLAADPPPLLQGPVSVFERCRRGAVGRDALAWLREVSARPVFVKGVTHEADAEICRALELAGVIVSNHGGRTVDGVAASFDVLPSIRAVLGDAYTILFDGGVRGGEDVLKALAAGADAVLIGRLQIYALAVAGALGVAHLLKLLREELALYMAATGCTGSAAARSADLLVRPPGED